MDFSKTSSAILDHLNVAIGSGDVLMPILLAVGAGFLTTLSPCIYPLIPITLSVMGASGHKDRWTGFLVALMYVMGMAVVYTALGAGFAYLGLLSGSLLQQPAVLLGIAALFALLALNTFGAFTWVLPEGILQTLTRIGGRGFKGAFLMGSVAGAIAAPCVGPVLAAILTLIAKSQNPTLGVALMAGFSLGLGIPFLFLGAFSQAAARMPRAGRWMWVLKLAIGTTMLLASGYYVKLALRPAAVDMTQGFRVLNENTADPALLDQWLAVARAQKKPVLIDFYADWCVLCREYEQIFADPEVQHQLDRFFLIKIDMTRTNAGLEKIQSRFAVVGLPAMVFFDSRGAQSQIRVTGLQNASLFAKNLSEID